MSLTLDPGPDATPDGGSEPTATTPPWHRLRVDSAAAALGADPATGLSAEEADRRLAGHGPNRLEEPPPVPRWRQFLDQFRSTLVIVLAGAAIVAAVIGDVADAVVIAVVLLANGVIGYVQEARAATAVDALKRMLATTVRVRRDGGPVEIDADLVVPGDLVLLEAGDRIPADGRLATAVDLEVDESSLTGESLPVAKTADPLDLDDPVLGDRHNELFANTTVVRGRAELLVTSTGMATEMGRIAGLLGEAQAEDTPLQRRLERLGTKLAIVAGVAVAVVFALQVARGASVGDALLAAVALAVAAIPEGLPAVVAVTLAVGMQQLAIRNAIVKRLHSVETLGSTTVICSDKTGTLTRNQMTARVAVLPGGRIDLEQPSTPAALADALLPAALCADAELTAEGPVGDPTELALVQAAADAGIDVAGVRLALPRLAEVPFDPADKFMATFHRDGDDVVVHVKGAPDVVLDRAGPLSAGAHDWSATNAELAGDGLRVLALAHRRIPAAMALDADGTVADPRHWIAALTIDALVGIADPPRPEARDAIALCRRAGVDVKMITGDHVATAAAIAAELGVRGRAVSGPELDELTDDELAEQVEDIGVFARVSPEHKVRVVRALQARGHITAMTGDGVNDAAALARADIGVAMGITGTEVTKEAADLVLADDNFTTIVGAVERGRAIYENILTFVRFQLTTSAGAVVTLLTASLLGLPAPLTAVQVLFVNIIADGPPAMTLGVDPPRGDVMGRPPRRPDEPILSRDRLTTLGIAAAVMAVGTLSVLTLADDAWGAAVGATMAFTTFVLFQLVNVFVVRSGERSVFGRHSLHNGKLWLAVAAVLGIQILAVQLPVLQDLFDTVALTPAQWLVSAAVASTVLVLHELGVAVRRLTGRTADAVAGASTSTGSAPSPQPTRR